MKVDVLFDGTNLRYQGEPLVAPLRRERTNDIGQVIAVVEINPDTLGYRAMKLMYNLDGSPFCTPSGLQKEDLVMAGNFTRPGKYSIKDRGRVQFFSKERLIAAKKERNRTTRLVERREDAVARLMEEAKNGDWGHVHFWAEGLSFADSSLITWPSKDEPTSAIVHPGVGPETSLADNWGGKRPDTLWTPDDAPGWCKSRLDKALTMLKKLPQIEQLSLLPEKGDISPIITLDGDALHIYRTVELSFK